MAAKTKIQHFRGTAARWTEINPVLAAGELGLETDTNKIKFGDGTSTWSALSYAGGSSSVTTLDSLTDVTAPSPATDDILKWNGTAWVNATPAATSSLPTQTGNAGELLVTNGTDASWSNTVQANAAATPALVVKGAASQSTSLQEWQDSTGTVKSKISSSGSIYAGSTIITSNGNMYIRPTVSATPLTVRDTGSGFIQEWKDSSEVATLASISSAGLLTAIPATPADTNSADNVGYVGMPQVSTATGITLSASHAGKHIYTTATGQTHTIPANASVPLEIGTTIVFINPASVTTSIAITTDTLLLAGTGTTGTRTLAPYGMATAVKITATSWLISGNGLS